MQPLNEILKEVGLPIWIFWGISAIAIVIAIICAVQENCSEAKSWFSMLPIKGITILVLTGGMIFYFANDSIKRRKAWDREQARHDGELAAIRAVPVLEEKKTVSLDQRLRSIDGIIGYLDQSIKMGREPKDLTPILLSLAKEIKNIRDGK